MGLRLLGTRAHPSLGSPAHLSSLGRPVHPGHPAPTCHLRSQVSHRTSPATGQSQRAGSCLQLGIGWVAGAGGAGVAVAAAWPGAEPAPEGGGGFAGGSGAGGPGAEPGSGVGAGTAGGLVLGGEKASPLGWSLVLYKEPSGHRGSGQRERCWAAHAVEPASLAPADSGQRGTPSLPVYLLCLRVSPCMCISESVLPGCVATAVCWPSPSF